MPPSSSRDGKLTLNVKNITVKELLQTIEKQSRYTFVYNISDLDPARRVSLSVTDASVEAVIAQAIPEVTATVRGTQVVLVRKAADKKAKDDAKNGGGVLQAIEAEPEEPEFVPEERVRPGAEPTAESVFGRNDD